MEFQNEQCASILKEVLNSLEDTRIETSALNRLEDSPFAEKAASRILYYLDRVKEELIDLSKEFKYEDLANAVRKTMSSDGPAATKVL